MSKRPRKLKRRARSLLLKLAQSCEIPNQHPRFASHLVPHRIKLSSNKSIKRTEQSVLDRQVLHFELRSSADQSKGSRRVCVNWPEMTYVAVGTLDLGQSSLHAVDDGRLDVEHRRSERLVHLDNVGFTLL